MMGLERDYTVRGDVFGSISVLIVEFFCKYNKKVSHQQKMSWFYIKFLSLQREISQAIEDFQDVLSVAALGDAEDRREDHIPHFRRRPASDDNTAGA